MIDVGRVCVKIAGRDAGKKCAIVSLTKDGFVFIDGETRRRKCNLLHLEPLDKMLDIKKDASRTEVVQAFKKIGVDIEERKSKPATTRPRTLRRSKLAQTSVEKKETPTTEKKESEKNPKQKQSKS